MARSVAPHWHALTSALIAFGVALALTPVMRRVALALGVLDQPVERSVHKTPVPLLGGVAIAAAFFTGTVYALGWDRPAVVGIIVGGTFIMLLGLVDDRLRLRPAVKLLGQVVAAGILVSFGVRIDHVTNPFGAGQLMLGVWSVPVTVLWVVAVINVINLIDGLDGLAAGIVSIASVVLIAAAVQTGQPWAAVYLAAVLAGSVVGFLPYNFNPAKIFMGDAGSMFLGFVMGAISVEGSLKSPTAVALAVPLLALGLPFVDTFLAIVRRWRRGLPIGTADREHVHHRLVQLGLTQREAVVVMYLVSGWLGVSALAITRATGPVAVVILAFVGLSLYFAARKMGMASRADERGIRT